MADIIIIAFLCTCATIETGVIAYADDRSESKAEQTVLFCFSPDRLLGLRSRVTD